jgi:hypothetical protein
VAKLNLSAREIAALREVVDYNWNDEERDYAKCAPEPEASQTGQNSREGHIFCALTTLRDALKRAGVMA